MGAPFTQVEIQEEIDLCKTRLREAMQAQQYSSQEGPAGEFSVEKGDVAKIRNTMKFWINMMDEYFPDAFSSDGQQITFTEAGYSVG